MVVPDLALIKQSRISAGFLGGAAEVPATLASHATVSLQSVTYVPSVIVAGYLLWVIREKT